jgi:HAD superfamily hydrolase (TIGR01509 family)
MIQAVIFDMDGLLIDNEPIWRRAHQTVLLKRHLHISQDDVRHMAGKGTLHIVELWRERFNGWAATEDQEICQEIFDEVTHSVGDEGVELPGVTSLVKALYEKHIPLAVASSSPLFLISSTLKKLGLDRYMPNIHSGVDEVHPKPAPDVYISAAKSLGVAPKNCLVFEDSPTGIKAAKAAGMSCIAVPEPGREPALFSEADAIIPSLKDFDVSSIAAVT